MKVHTVQKGDTLWKISKMHGISLEALIAANPQIPNPDQIDVGMQVNVPSGSTAAPVPAPEPTGIGMEGPAVDLAPLPPAAPAQLPTPAPTPSPEMMTPPPAAPEPAYPSVPKWEGLWKYVVKHGDSMFKIAKQVGVTLEHLKAANPQVPNPDKIYPGQVLNIPSSGMKSKAGNPGSSLKEQLTSPMATQPFPKEQLLKPKEMAPVENPIMTPPSVVSPAMEMPMPMPAAPAPLPIPDINLNLQYAPHKHHAITFAPQKEIANNFNTNIGNFPLSNTHNVAAAQQQQQSAPITNSGMMPTPVVSPVAMAPMHPMQQTMLYYIPVSIKKKKKHKQKHKCHKKMKKCGCQKHHHHHHPHHQMMLQHMGLFPKTFYREED